MDALKQQPYAPYDASTPYGAPPPQSAYGAPPPAYGAPVPTIVQQTHFEIQSNPLFGPCGSGDCFFDDCPLGLSRSIRADEFSNVIRNVNHIVSTNKVGMGIIMIPVLGLFVMLGSIGLFVFFMVTSVTTMSTSSFIYLPILMITGMFLFMATIWGAIFYARRRANQIVDLIRDYLRVENERLFLARGIKWSVGFDTFMTQTYNANHGYRYNASHRVKLIVELAPPV